MPLCCCVSLFRLCHITRVYVGFFILTCYIHCVSVLSMPSECCVCAVVCGLILFSPPLFTVFICVTPHPTGLHLGKQKHALQLLTNTAPQQICFSAFSSCTDAQDSSGSIQTFKPSMLEYISGSKRCTLTCVVFHVKSSP